MRDEMRLREVKREGLTIEEMDSVSTLDLFNVYEMHDINERDRAERFDNWLCGFGYRLDEEIEGVA